MMKLQIDDQISEFSPLAHANVEEMVAQVMATLPPNRIVREIVLDGRTLSKREELTALKAALEAVHDVQIRTADRAVWASDGIDSALLKLARVHISLLRTAELFRDGKTAEANRCFVLCLEGLERFLDLLVLTRSALAIDFNLIRSDERSLGQLEAELCKILKSILCAQETKDNDSIAERVECALLPNLSAWSRALGELKRMLESNA